MKIIKSFAYVMALSLVVGVGYSQDSPVKNLLVNYINSVNSVGHGTQKEDVMNLFHNTYRSNTAYVKMSGIVSRTSSGKEEVASMLDEIVQDNNYRFKLTLDKVLYTAQKERAGTISALVNFESIIEDKTAEKGSILMNLVGSKIDGEWKIVHNNTVRVSESKDVGNCACYLYSKGSTKFVTEVYYPSGVEYGHTFESFRVTTRDGKRIITSDAHDFNWDDDGNVIYEGRTIGTTEEAKEAIQMALKDLYKESCLKMLFN
ncbi:hypothetical protein [Abyssalbus ytuae]|uniref:Uncharacterized protein n=1 Tax=Abyssalbus ytuae TaxID=2926907 RepID=A0A9E7A2T3_9FLAO|nr:hypothetical protein [Abyssalbus ytuae]UOB18786.1 hypothetical protein MQE35_05700 [Abyssalbus ytuae]